MLKNFDELTDSIDNENVLSIYAALQKIENNKVIFTPEEAAKIEGIQKRLEGLLDSNGYTKEKLLGKLKG